MKKIVLDLDTGIDDTLALTYVLASPDAELIGVTGTYGNVLMDTGLKNDLDLLAMFGREDIPVFRGIDHPSDKDVFTLDPDCEIFHGKNGVGNAVIPAESSRDVEEQSAVDFIIECARKYDKDEFVYVPTGASTNLDAAFQKAPDIVDRIRVVMMGGALTQPGNMNMFEEANVFQDPSATNRVFAANPDLTMVGLDVTMQTLMTEEQNNELRAVGTPVSSFLADMVDYYIRISKEIDGAYQGGCNLHDPLAAAVALDPTLVGTFPINLMVETEGAGRGRTIGDPNRLKDVPKNVKVALTVDADRFVGQFMDRILTFAKTF